MRTLFPGFATTLMGIFLATSLAADTLISDIPVEGQDPL
jgi:hypothetical protein